MTDHRTSPPARRRAILGLAGAGLALPFVARAQAAWPNRPLRFIVPLGPGGATDIVMRLIAPRLQEKLGQPCVVENRVGAGGVVGTDYVTKQPPDGYTFVHCAVASAVIAEALYPSLPYNPERDLLPIAPTVFVPLTLSVTRRNLAVNSLAELIAELRARPGQLSFASNGTGATSHLAGANLLALTGTRAEHVPYRSGAEALAALINGDVHFAFDIAGLHGPQHRDGRIHTIMVSPNRVSVMPDIPNNTEAGLPQLKAYSWFGIFGPTGVPEPIVQRLASVIGETMAEPAIRERLDTAGMPPMLDYTPARFAAFIREERAFWLPIVRASGARVQ